jgi:hypothetical protein
VRVSLTASGAIVSASMPVTIILRPPAAIPLGIVLVIITAIVVWHLRRGGRATVRRTQRGNLTFTLDSTRRNR